MPLPLANPEARTCRPALNHTYIRFRRLNAPGALGLWHLGSLDAPTVAVVWTLAFGWAAGVRLPAWIVTVSALVVWGVYLADRLLDAWHGWQSGRLELLRARHHFHWRHRRTLTAAAAVSLGTAALLALLSMPARTAGRNAALGAAALVYFSGVHGGRWRSGLRRAAKLTPKELLVGVLFAAGCALPALDRAFSPPVAACAALYACLAWLNCWAIERWESGAHSHKSGKVAVRAAAVGAAALMLAFRMAPASTRAAALALAAAAAALLLAALDLARPRLTELALRASADLVLLTPALLLALR